MLGKRCLTCIGEIEKNDMIKNIMRRKVFSSSWVFYIYVFIYLFIYLFIYIEKMSSSLHMVLVMLFIHVGKRSNSRSQMFFETGALKNFAIFTGKHLCWSLFLIRLKDWRPAFPLEKRLQHSCFSVNIAKCLKAALLWNTCSLYFSEILCDGRY